MSPTTTRAAIPLLLSIVVVSACASEDPSAPPTMTNTEAPTAAVEPAHYVALGDSFAAMGGRSTELRVPEFCLRAADNYASLLEADVDVTCQGAVTDDLLGPRALPDGGELPAQVDALLPETTMVTLSIGGNDIGFGDISTCIQTSVAQGLPSGCAASTETSVRDQLAQLPGRLDAVHDAIQERAADARVIVTGYLPLITAGGECPELSFVSDTDRAWAAALTDEVNDVVRQAAQRHGADFVLPEDAKNHTACAEPDQRWADVVGQHTDAHPMHLTPAGHEAMAAAIRGDQPGSISHGWTSRGPQNPPR